jgi:prepilin-type N-terminal cleavage/methylation domain-containing protein
MNTNGQRGGYTFMELVVVISVIAALAAMGFPAYRYLRRQADVGATQSVVSAVASAIGIYPQKTWSWTVDYMVRTPTGYLGTSSAAPWSPTGAQHWGLKKDAESAASGSSKTFAVPYQPVAFLWDLNIFDGSWNPTIGKEVPVTAPKFHLIDGTPALSTDATHDGGFLQPILDSGYTGFYNMVQPAIQRRFVNKKHQVIDAWGQPLRIAFASNVYGSLWFGVWSAGPDKVDYDATQANPSADDITSWKIQ